MQLNQQKTANIDEDQKYILLCNIVDYLRSYGITKNKEISDLANILLSHDKLRGIKRSNTCYRKKMIEEKVKFDNSASSLYTSTKEMTPSCAISHSPGGGAPSSECDVKNNKHNDKIFSTDYIKERVIDKEVSRIINEVMTFMERLKIPCKFN